MRDDVKHPTHTEPELGSSFVPLLSGWVQQGFDNFFATQRLLVDLAVRQNAAAINLVSERFANPKFSPVKILAELASDGMTNFIAGQRVLLDLVRQENEILMHGIKDRVSLSDGAVAVADLARRSLNTFVELQQDFLKIAGKQTHNWLAAVGKGKAYDGEQFVAAAREGIDHFVQAQQKFLNLITKETSKATHFKSEAARKASIEEISALARQASECFVEAQKKLMDVASHQVNANLKASDRALAAVKPLLAVPLPEIAREGFRALIDAEKALIETMTKRPVGSQAKARKVPRAKRTARTIKTDAVQA